MGDSAFFNSYSFVFCTIITRFRGATNSFRLKIILFSCLGRGLYVALAFQFSTETDTSRFLTEERWTE